MPHKKKYQNENPEYYIYQGVPLNRNNNRYFYRNDSPVPADEIWFMSYTLQRIYEMYVSPLHQLPTVFEHALKEYCRYYLLCPLFDDLISVGLTDKFRFIEALTPAEMILDLLEYDLEVFKL